MANVKEIRPQLGAQTTFLTNPADIRIYGGAAGGGKSWSILLEALRGVPNPAFNAVFFRRTFPMIRNPGGLWDASCQLYPFLGARPRESALTWQFATGANVVMRHLKLDSSVYDWQGAEICYIAFDELTHFTENQFWYMLSRNRSTCGIRPYMVGTCNPDSDSWVRKLIDWWIDPDTGLAIPERSGVVRHFVRRDGELHWMDEPDSESKSFTFILASIYENKALLAKDPGYLNNLKSLPLVDRERLLGGNWNVKAVAGMVFRQDWFPVIETMPSLQRAVRYWDFAASVGGSDPDFTASVKVGLTTANRVVILDATLLRGTPIEVDRALVATSSQDGYHCPQRWQRDPGQAGIYQDNKLRELLRGFEAMGIPSTLSKLDRAKPLSKAAESAQVDLLRGNWNQPFLNELAQFPDGLHDDYVDAAAGAYNCLTGNGGLGSASSGSFKA